MPIGGYKIIDLKGANLSESKSVNMPGIYELIESTLRKPTLLTNFFIKNVDAKSAFVTFYGVGNSYYAHYTAGQWLLYSIRIENNDAISLYIANVHSTAGDEPVDAGDGPSASM